MKSERTIVEELFEQFLSRSKPKRVEAGWQECDSVEALGHHRDQQVGAEGESELTESSKLLLELAQPHLEELKVLADEEIKPKGELEPFQYTLN